MSDRADPPRLRERLRVALRDAMAARDAVAVSALRGALGAIDNAEAVDVPTPGQVGDTPVAGAVVGLGAGDVPRRHLTEDEVAAVVAAEVDERLTVAGTYARAGRAERAGRLRAEARVLGPHVARP